jgi:two-component system sensor histidine kinase DctS
MSLAPPTPARAAEVQAPAVASAAALAPAGERRGWRRALLWGALVALLIVAQTMLVWFTANYESARSQEQVEALASGVASDIKQTALSNLQSLQALLWNDPDPAPWRADAAALLRGHREILRIERRDAGKRVTAWVDTPYQLPVFSRLRRSEIDLETELACVAAARQTTPIYSRSYFIPLPDGLGIEVIDVCLPVQRTGRIEGFMAATISLGSLLAIAAGPEALRDNELSFVEGDGTRLARGGRQRGAGVYVSERLVDLPGLTLRLRLDSGIGSPRFIPTLQVALVLGLSLGLGSLVLLLVRDMRRRSAAERALAESLAFRQAMEDSLVTGLRARDLEGRITYVNPAFCQMVGFTAEELIGRTRPPYWPPELIDQYAERQAQRLAPSKPRGDAREGFDTTFVRKSGERFDTLIFEAPLVDGAGQHTGWMSTILDVSDRRRIEELSRQQQERLQASARLATVGEMASLLSHELNQPLAAIASYATGSLNLMDSAPQDPEAQAMLRQAAERIAQQAERAGRVIKSVHDFVRRREQAREPIRCDALIEAVLPLVRLQSRKSGSRVEIDLPQPVPRVVCDRTMLEQVVLNLTRNGIQAMEEHTPLAERELRVRVRQTHARWVTISVIDHGPGIPNEVAQRLFTPFFTTRREGMGLGLSLCRTVIEQHGGALDFVNVKAADGRVVGAEFRFTLPADGGERRAAAPSSEPTLHEQTDGIAASASP